METVRGVTAQDVLQTYRRQPTKNEVDPANGIVKVALGPDPTPTIDSVNESDSLEHSCHAPDRRLSPGIQTTATTSWLSLMPPTSLPCATTRLHQPKFRFRCGDRSRRSKRRRPTPWRRFSFEEGTGVGHADMDADQAHRSGGWHATRRRCGCRWHAPIAATRVRSGMCLFRRSVSALGTTLPIET